RVRELSMPLSDVFATMLRVIEATAEGGFLVTRAKVFQETAKALQWAPSSLGQDELLALLDGWQELHRTGVLASGAPFSLLPLWEPHLQEHERDARVDAGMARYSHLTWLGRIVTVSIGQDPNNPAGYLAHVRSILPAASIPLEYVEEAVRTYMSDCNRATAVLIGAASESLALDLREAMCAKLTAASIQLPKGLTDPRPNVFLAAVKKLLDDAVTQKRLTGDLAERYQAHWDVLVHRMRMARNEAGHPVRVAPMDRGFVHSLLSTFPTLARLALDLTAWVG